MLTTVPALLPAGRYNASQAAKALGVDRKTIARWRDAGKLRPCLVGTRTYYRGSDLLKIWTTK